MGPRGCRTPKGTRDIVTSITGVTYPERPMPPLAAVSSILSILIRVPGPGPRLPSAAERPAVTLRAPGGAFRPPRSPDGPGGRQRPHCPSSALFVARRRQRGGVGPPDVASGALPQFGIAPASSSNRKLSAAAATCLAGCPAPCRRAACNSPLRPRRHQIRNCSPCRDFNPVGLWSPGREAAERRDRTIVPPAAVARVVTRPHFTSRRRSPLAIYCAGYRPAFFGVAT